MTPSEQNPFDPYSARDDFAILQQSVRNKPLVYLDNAATTQKPKSVIQKLTQCYEEEYANIHRGVHYLSEVATQNYEATRNKVRDFINAAESKEIIFTKGTTDSINLVASSLASQIKTGDEILISAMEHHSNIVPWQILCEKTGAKLVVSPINQKGELIVDEFKKRLTDKTKLTAIVHVSNALGTVNPINEITQWAHDKGSLVLIDGAQAVAHQKVDVQKIDCDFYAFSAHKLYGPTGVGVLYGKADILNQLPPYQSGGDMIEQVTFEKTTYNSLPYKFEAGTPNIAGVTAFAASLDYLNQLDWEGLVEHEEELLRYATEKLSQIDAITFIGQAENKSGLVSFTIKGVHPHDSGTILDQQGIAVRAGHHCAQPVMDFYNIPATVRASFALYNTSEDVDKLMSGIDEVLKIFG